MLSQKVKALEWEVQTSVQADKLSRYSVYLHTGTKLLVQPYGAHAQSREIVRGNATTSKGCGQGTLWSESKSRPLQPGIPRACGPVRLPASLPPFSVPPSSSFLLPVKRFPILLSLSLSPLTLSRQVPRCRASDLLFSDSCRTFVPVKQVLL